MRALKNVLIAGAMLWGATCQAQSLELQAISDFTNFDSGEVPYYLDIAGDRKVLAINAAIPEYRDRFARAEHEFIGADGLYDITINALGEIDGDGMYRLLVNGIVLGAAVNSPVSVDYTIIEHTFKGIALTSPATIGVESSAVSNNKIPEGDGYAFARGRWKSVTINPSESVSVEPAASTDLAISLSTLNSKLISGNEVPFIATVVNASAETTATSPTIEFQLPDGIEFVSSETCVANATGARCALPQLAPNDTGSVALTTTLLKEGWQSVSASVASAQSDSDRSNNVDVLSFEIAAPKEVDPVSVLGGQSSGIDNSGGQPSTMSSNTTNDSSKKDSGAGALGITIMAFILVALTRLLLTNPTLVNQTGRDRTQQC